MSGFEVFGVVSAALPLITTALPSITKFIETVRNSAAIKAESVETIASISSELKVAFAILEQLGYQHRTARWGDQRVAEEFTSLFQGFPETVDRLSRECEELTEGRIIWFIFQHHKLDETIQELERQMQRLFRRMTLLITYLQREIPDASWAIQYSARGNRPSKVRELLKAQLDQNPSRLIKNHNEKSDLYGRYDIGPLYISRIRRSKKGPLVVVEDCEFRGKESMRLGELSAQEVLQKLSVDPPSDWLGILACQAAWWNHRGNKSSRLTIIYRLP